MQAEMARHIVHDGKWFVTNADALRAVQRRQTAEQTLLAPSEVDLARAERTGELAPEVHQMPGLAPVLAATWLVGPDTYRTLQWLQILIDTGMIVVLFWVVRRLTASTVAGLVGALLYAVWPGSIVVASRPVLDTWAIFFTLGGTALFVWTRDRDSRMGLMALGALTGLGIYFRPFVLALPLLLGLVAYGHGWRKRLVGAAIPTTVALLVLTPWVVRNYVEFDRFIPTRTGLGQALYEGAGQATSDEQTARDVRRKNPNARYGTPAYDDVALGAAFDAIRDDPSGWFRNRVVPRIPWMLPMLLVLLLPRPWRRGGLVPVAAAASVVLPYVPIGGDTRFYLPAAPAYLMLVAMVAVAAGGVALRAWRRTARRPEPVEALN